MGWSHESALDAATSVAPVVFANRAVAESTWRMAPEVREAMGAEGLFALAVPADHGGRESPLPEIGATIEVVGAADASAAWHLANTLSAPMATTYLPADARDEVFAGDLRRPYCVSNSPTGSATPQPGGFRLDGDWPFVTGVLDGEWVVLAARLQHLRPAADAGPGPVRIFVTRTSVLEVHSTWSAAVAMKGTGSNAVTAEDHFVEDRFATSWGASSRLDGPLYRLPIPTMVFFPTGAIALGILASCLQATIELVGRRVSRADGGAYLDKPRIQEAIVEGDAALRSLRAGYHAAMTELWDVATTRALVPGDDGRAIAATFHAIDGARDAVSSLYLASTPIVYGKANAVDRALRDIYAISVGVEALRTYNLHTGRQMLQDPTQWSSRP